MHGDFERIASIWMEWSAKTFKKADCFSSLDKAVGEIDELQHALSLNFPREILHEYADVIMCILHSAKLAGFSIEQITQAIREKTNINVERKWILDANGKTYSHKK
jgi:hypothetical protein